MTCSMGFNPNDCLPTEILEQIFVRVVDSSTQLNLPPDTNDHPWVLGRVCRSWRLTSRSIPQFWKTSIKFNNPSLKNVVDVSDLRLKQLECAAEILPLNAFISLSVYVRDHKPVVPIRSLIPYLSLISHLTWCYTSHNPNQESEQVLFPGNLSQVKTPTLTPNASSVSTSLVGLFGQTSRLESLELLSNSPAVLLSDIPWRSLSLLKLSFGDPNITDPTRPLWMELATLDPFCRMTSLTTLHLDVFGDYLDVILSYSFPWRCLQTFAVYWYDRPDLFPKFMKIVEKCTSLLALDFQCPFNARSEPFLLDLVPQGFSVPPLVDLRVGSKVSSATIKLLSSSTLSSLIVGEHFFCEDPPGVLLQDFYTIIEYCPCLATVLCPMTRDENIVPIRTVIAPRLTSLTIHLQFEGNATMFPTMLQAPALEELSLTGLDVCGADLLPGYIVDLITRSNVRLRRFNLCLCIGLPSPSFTELLFLLDACTSVTIDNPSFPDDLTEAIATKDLFPCVEHLDLYSRSNDAPKLFLKSMQTRLEQEAALGATILKHLVLRFDFDLRDDDCGIYGTKAKFRELGTHYGVECKIFWVYEPENEG